MNVSNAIYKKEVLIWTPVLATEPINMLLEWVYAVKKAGFDNVVLIYNGPGSERATTELQKEISGSKILITCLSGPASIGACQEFVTHIFLRSKARFLVRLDSDLQFPVKCAEKLLLHFEIQPGAVCPDVIVGQREEASTGGYLHFLGNAVLRLFALLFGIFADPNSGFYALNRKAAALLCNVPLSNYPEPRMLVAFRQALFGVTTCVVPTLPRHAGRSSIRGFWQALKVFTRSFLELVSCNLI